MMPLAECIHALTYLPQEFEDFGQDDIYCKERYWFMIVLKDTPFTRGEVNLAGWNSKDEADHARKAYKK